jgi:hypothetical protein
MGYLGQGSHITISHNYFWNNSYQTDIFNHSIYVSGDNGALQTGLTISDNEIHAPASNAGVSIVMHGVHDTVTIENNRITNEQGSVATGWGIALGCGGYAIASNTTNLTLRGNSVFNAGNSGIAVACCQHCLIENNLVVNTQQQTNGIAAPSEYAADFGAGYTACSDMMIRNNTVYVTSPSSTGINTGGEGTGWVIENNVVQSSANCFMYNAAPYTSRDYNASYGCSDAVVGSHSWKANPQWAVLGSDFRPAVGSPLIGAADPAQNPGIDLGGVTRPTTPSIGAYE